MRHPEPNRLKVSNACFTISTEAGTSRKGGIAMVYILTLLIFAGGNVAVATAEYNTSEACEAARAIDERAFASDFRQPAIVATCTPKG